LPKPSPPLSSTDSIFLPPKFWKPRSLGAVSVVAAVALERGLIRLKKPAAAKGTLLDRSVTVPLGAPLVGGIVCIIGGEMSLLPAIFLRRQRKSIRSSSRMMVNPATPPTTPPTTVGVDGALLPPDPVPGLAVDEGAVPVELLPLPPPMPPGMTPVPEVVLAELEDDRVDDCEEVEEVDEIIMVDEESVMVEVA